MGTGLENGIQSGFIPWFLVEASKCGIDNPDDEGFEHEKGNGNPLGVERKNDWLISMLFLIWGHWMFLQIHCN